MFGLVLKAKRPAVVAVFFREVNAAIIPWIAVAAVAGLHGDERCAGGVRGGVLEQGAGTRGGGLVLAAV